MTNRAKAEIDPKAFLQFAFVNQKRTPTIRKLTAQQQIIRDLTKLQGLSPKEIAKSTGISPGCVYDGLVKIREKGWL